MTAALVYPHFDPIALQLGPFAIRWYALAYIAGLVLGWRLTRRLAQQRPRVATPEQVDDFLTWATLGVVLGGRLGYVLFYQPALYFSHPAQIFQVWHGGMSFHGGAIGVAVAIVWFCRQNQIRPLAFADRIAVCVPIGLGLGRIANFINGELWGRPAADWWPGAMIFPQAGPPFVPRYPSELYEAFLEGVVLFAVLLLLARGERFRAHSGFLTGAFLVGYGVCRIIAECFRQPDAFGLHRRRADDGTDFVNPDDRAWRGADLVQPAGRGARMLEGGALIERLDAFMARANVAYYATHDPFADFTTGPEITQVFGEILGLWAAVVWQQIGRPDPVLLAEAGPGRGTLMADALRAIGQTAPAFHKALSVQLIETSPRLRALQAARLPDATWHAGLESLPDLPLILLANEFLDALPIRQFVRRGDGWTERYVGPVGLVEVPVTACSTPSPPPGAERVGERWGKCERLECGSSVPCNIDSARKSAAVCPPPHPTPLRPQGRRGSGRRTDYGALVRRFRVH